jgi:hypothetical protein
MAIRTRVEIDEELTYGDLYAFVDLARATSTPATSKVKQVLVSEQEPELGIGSLEIEISSATGIESPVTLMASEARSLAKVLDLISQAEHGDARDHIGELMKWHDRLLGLLPRNS